MRRAFIIAAIALAVSITALATPRAARADVYVATPNFGFYFGDGHRHGRHWRRDYYPRHYYRDHRPRGHYGRDYGPPRQWRRHGGWKRWRHGRWRRGHGHWGHGPRRGHGHHHGRRHWRRW